MPKKTSEKKKKKENKNNSGHPIPSEIPAAVKDLT